MRKKNNQRREQPPEGVPVEKNGEYIADVVGFGHDGEGVGRVDGFTLFIHGALPGERVRVKVLKVKKQYATPSCSRSWRPALTVSTRRARSTSSAAAVSCST